MIVKFRGLIENQQKDIDSSIEFISDNLNKLDTTTIELKKERPIVLADVLNNNLRLAFHKSKKINSILEFK